VSVQAGSRTPSQTQMENVFFEDEARASQDIVELELIRLIEENPDVVVLSADMGGAIPELRERHPGRYLEFGIAETNTVSVAAGLAAGGLVPYVLSMAPFGAIKCAEQIRTDLAYTRLPVRIVARLSGLAMGFFGPSHHAVEDIAITRSIAGLTVVAPSDTASTTALLRSTAEHPGPVYMRVSAGIQREVHPQVPDIPYGRFVTARDGSDVTVIATGTGVAAAVGAAEVLADEGISACVLDAAYLKPLDEEAILAAAERTGAIVTVEEHNVVGGLGSAVAEVLGRHGASGKILLHGLPDEELEVGTPAALLERYGITPAGVAGTVRRLLST
jgi:transketolase